MIIIRLVVLMFLIIQNFLLILFKMFLHLSNAVNWLFRTIKLIMYCVYRFHHFSINDFILEFVNLLESDKSNNIIIMRDININILGLNISSTNYLTILAQQGFISLMNRVTRPSSGTCLDHIPPPSFL